ncbi:GGDEF domain-containing protein [Alteraurantiacibacter aquimixticola]|uniref:diguanylate cyclase n=1 Tax=Alteraurantiacibacter aquimixticola TaxID=2489173 RepID=A0A4T3EYG8_9SPHN|nr:diguanylate cyclase [Alteraurantiacibacter aquimixticola]TIX49646.1 diguanylate cyclase [Alteraurantiacibacter aquimixticola]
MLLAALFGANAVAAAPVSFNAEPGESLPLGPIACTVGSNQPISWVEASERTLNCGDDRFSDGSAHVWSYSDLSSTSLPDGPLVWQADPTSFERLTLVFEYADGERIRQEYGPRIAVANWFAGTRFGVDIPHRDARLTGIAFGFDRAQARATFSSARIVDRKTADQLHYHRSLLYMLMLALLLLPILYDCLFFYVLKERFNLLHLGMAVAMVAYVSSSSGLLFILLPEIALRTRWSISLWGFAICVAMAMMFARSFIEPGLLGRWMKRSMAVTAVFLVSVTAFVDLGGEATRYWGNQLYFISYVPVVAVLFAAISAALKQGSRSAKFLVAGWAGIVFAGLERATRGLGLSEAPAALDDMMYIALCIEIIVTSLGVADRFMTLRRERDRAQEEEAKLIRLAERDGLTGLLNRRAFDDVDPPASGRALAILDLDHFKSINDTYGHQTGDDVLRSVARILNEVLSSVDHCAAYRIGGEEFALLLPAATISDAQGQADLVRAQIELGANAEIDLKGHRITASFGIGMIDERGMAAAYRDADAALYSAKKHGRNRVAIAA